MLQAGPGGPCKGDARGGAKPGAYNISRYAPTQRYLKAVVPPASGRVGAPFPTGDHTPTASTCAAGSSVEEADDIVVAADVQHVVKPHLLEQLVGNGGAEADGSEGRYRRVAWDERLRRLDRRVVFTGAWKVDVREAGPPRRGVAGKRPWQHEVRVDVWKRCLSQFARSAQVHPDHTFVSAQLRSVLSAHHFELCCAVIIVVLQDDGPLAPSSSGAGLQLPNNCVLPRLSTRKEPQQKHARCMHAPRWFRCAPV